MTPDECVRIVRALDYLRENMGAVLLIPYERPDFDGPAMFVEVSEPRIAWWQRRFEGDSLLACLEAAAEDKRRQLKEMGA